MFKFLKGLFYKKETVISKTLVKTCCDSPDFVSLGCWKMKEFNNVFGGFYLELSKIDNTHLNIYKDDDRSKVIATCSIYMETYIQKKACLNCGTCFGKEEYVQNWIKTIKQYIKKQERYELAEKICKG